MTTLRAVLDAQVWVSGGINATGPARGIINAALEGAFRIVTARYIQEEVLDVFSREKVRRFLAPGFDAAEWVSAVERAAADVIAETNGPRVVSADPDDDPYLWTAWASGATHVVTWDEEVLNVKHFHGTAIIEPVAFIRVLRDMKRYACVSDS